MDKWLAGLIIVSFVILPVLLVGNLNEAAEAQHEPQPESLENSDTDTAQAAPNGSVSTTLFVLPSVANASEVNETE